MLCPICHQPRPCPLEVEKTSGTALPSPPSSANPGEGFFLHLHRQSPRKHFDEIESKHES